MSPSGRIRLTMVCAQCNGEDTGEAWCGYQWVSRLSEYCDITLLTVRFPGFKPPSEQLSGVKVIEWNASPFLHRLPRANRALKPWYPLFYTQARKWLKQAVSRRETFEVVHHLTPMALRFPSPCAGLGLPFLIGPVAGGLPTPLEFQHEIKTEPTYFQLRKLDDFRLRFDPLLRRTYEKAEVVICSAPYVQDKFSALQVRKMAVEPEVGIDELAPQRQGKSERDGLRLLYVGRVVRTKGLRDAIRAMGKLSDLGGVTLDVAGDGEDMAACRQEAEQCGVGSRVRFLGRQSRPEVERLYEEADVFLFPSFREPTGIVLFEAMRHGLPIITTDIGGPGHIVTDECGIRVPARDPKQFATDLAAAIRRLAGNTKLRQQLSAGAHERVAEIGLWDKKVDRMVRLYRSVLEARQDAVGI